ncbi:MAG: Asp-tRNA(Asn)/Glu-tRNA(Gln) amidotransferase subunit GatC [Deltaproteobacteria bacterium]|nr:Asp-tRNA(Asn)/Glu-tRNA(Gln) amidotransferase subunit GatC [Deltaproteobacteria bacterium]
MKIDKNRVDYVATLARLKLSEEEERVYASQLSHILGYIETLNQVNTEGIEPTYNVIDHKNIFRSEDLKIEKEENKSLFENAPELKDSYIKVPKIIDV